VRGCPGDLKNPGRSIPLGYLAVPFVGMLIIFLLIGISCFGATSGLGRYIPNDYGDSHWQGWWIISHWDLHSSYYFFGTWVSLCVVPRTLQAICSRRVIFPTPKFNHWLSKGKGEKK